MDKKLVYLVDSTSGEIIASYNKEDMFVVRKESLDGFNKSKIIDTQSKRPYVKLFIDTIGSIHKLRGATLNVYMYICEIVSKRRFDSENKLLFSSNAHTYKLIQDRCRLEDGNSYSVPAIKAGIGELEKRGFIFKYKDSDGFTCKGLYIINPSYVYSGTPNEYVDDIFKLSKKGLIVLFDKNIVEIDKI